MSPPVGNQPLGGYPPHAPGGYPPPGQVRPPGPGAVGPGLGPQRKKARTGAVGKLVPFAFLADVGAIAVLVGLFFPYFNREGDTLSWADAADKGGSSAPFFLSLLAVTLALFGIVLAFFARKSSRRLMGSLAGLLQTVAGGSVLAHWFVNFSPDKYGAGTERSSGFWIIGTGAVLLTLGGIAVLSVGLSTKNPSPPEQPFAQPPRPASHPPSDDHHGQSGRMPAGGAPGSDAPWPPSAGSAPSTSHYGAAPSVGYGQGEPNYPSTGSASGTGDGQRPGWTPWSPSPQSE